MPRPDAAKLVAAALPALQHPDGTILRGIGFDTLLMQASGDTAAVESINVISLLHGEAIIHTLETNGYTISHKDDPQPINTAGMKVATINCASCNNMIAQAVIDDQLQASVPGAAFITAITKRRLECPHG